MPINSGQVNKNDPNDARSVAVAALRARDLAELTAEDHTEVMRIWSRRYHDAVLCELVPGGFAKKSTVAHAVAIRLRHAANAYRTSETRPRPRNDHRSATSGRAARDARARAARAVAASGTSITDIPGVGPIIAGAVLGYVRDIGRFADRDHFASYNGTAPIEVCSATARSTGSPAAGTGSSTTPSTWPRSPRSATAAPRAARTTTRRSPKE